MKSRAAVIALSCALCCAPLVGCASDDGGSVTYGDDQFADAEAGAVKVPEGVDYDTTVTVSPGDTVATPCGSYTVPESWSVESQSDTGGVVKSLVLHDTGDEDSFRACSVTLSTDLGYEPADLSEMVERETAYDDGVTTFETVDAKETEGASLVLMAMRVEGQEATGGRIFGLASDGTALVCTGNLAMLEELWATIA